MYAQIAHSVLVRRVRVSLGRARIGVATTLLLAVGTSLSCREASKAATSDPSPVTLRFGVATPKTPDAAIGIRAFVNSLFSESLVTTRADGRPMDRLASSWTWSPDFLTLELKIRDNLKFHDGTPVDNNYIKDYLTQAFKNPSVSYKSVTRIDALPGNVVAIRLERPEALFLAELSNTTISIRDPKKADIGLGAYRLLERGPRTRLAAFPGFYRGKPRIDSIEILEFEEQRASWAALLRGEIDAVHEILPSALDFLPGQTSVRAYSFTRPYFTHLLFNVKHPVLKDARVRQALSYAVDRQAIIDGALDGQGVVADGPIWPHHWAYAAQKTYTHNIEAATLRLDAAGLRLGKVREAGHMPSRFRFKCLTVERNATFEKIAILLQKQLYDIGVDMEIETVSLDQLGARFTAGNYDAILAERTTARSLYWTYIAFHSTKLGGPYKSADATLDHLRGATDDSTVRADVSDLQRIFHEDPPAIFIAWPKVARVVSTKFVVPIDSRKSAQGRESDGRTETADTEDPGADIIPTIYLWHAVGSR
jgi:peptide/nickel transport system substrate-binding protein